MLAIRLQRNGRKALPLYRIVVQEAQRHPLSGRIVAQVGSYNPHTKEISLDKEKVEKYLGNESLCSKLLCQNAVRLSGCGLFLGLNFFGLCFGFFCHSSPPSLKAKKRFPVDRKPLFVVLVIRF